MQVKFSPYGQTGDLGVRSKVQKSLKVNFKDFYKCSHKNKNENILNGIGGWDLGALGGQ